ncbi:MAG: methylated-DNA--[protein]-cysteine S-methyltransferase [Oscillospiraceae bacterium]|nr:methylated-DNA--[protein]-cysteine S-methyltransferase [Oscillospiraceae bacterium]
MAATENAVTGLWFDGQKYFGNTLSPNCEEKSLPIFDRADLWLDIYFGGKIPDFTPPIFLKSTDFRIAVWEILLKIPYGKTMTYGEIAAEIASQRNVPKMSAQAVGNAVGRNPISLIIPCHRVVGADGSLTGYAGGIDKKARLLELEKAEIYR